MKLLTFSCIILITTLASDSIGKGSDSVERAYLIIQESVQPKVINERLQLESVLRDAKSLNREFDTLKRELNLLKQKTI